MKNGEFWTFKHFVTSLPGKYRNIFFYYTYRRTPSTTNSSSPPPHLIGKKCLTHAKIIRYFWEFRFLDQA